MIEIYLNGFKIDMNLNFKHFKIPQKNIRKVLAIAAKFEFVPDQQHKVHYVPLIPAVSLHGHFCPPWHAVLWRTVSLVINLGNKKDSGFSNKT